MAKDTWHTNQIKPDNGLDPAAGVASQGVASQHAQMLVGDSEPIPQRQNLPLPTRQMLLSIEGEATIWNETLPLSEIFIHLFPTCSHL